MNKDILKGQWKELKGEAKKKWGKLTDDDLLEIEGEADKLTEPLPEDLCPYARCRSFSPETASW
jgi:hypothetical protein